MSMHDDIHQRRKEVRRLTKANWSRPEIAAHLGCTVDQVQHDRAATRTRKRAPALWSNTEWTAERRVAVDHASRPRTRRSNRELARLWGVSTETIRADRQSLGLTDSVGRVGKRRSDIVGFLLAGQTPAEIARRVKRHRKTIERDVRIVLGGMGRQAFVAAQSEAGMPVNFAPPPKKKKRRRRVR